MRLDSDVLAERIDQLRREAGLNVRFTSQLDPLDPEASVLVAGRPSDELLDALPNLTTLVVPFVGIPATTLAQAAARPAVRLLHVHHNAQAVAEGALALLFATARRVVPMHEALRSLDWRPRYAPDPALRLSGHRALLVGFGAIGQRIAPVLAAVGMQVDAVRRTPRQTTKHVREYGPAELGRLLKGARVVVVSLPSTSETRGLFDGEMLACFASDSVLINVGRADVFDEAALFDALESRRIGAAGIDVWYRYPRDEAARVGTPLGRHPFHSLPNVVLSPHRTGHDDLVESDRARAVGKVLQAISSGAPLDDWEVDVAAGY